MNSTDDNIWTGVFPATLCPFTATYDVDEPELARYLSEIAFVDGVKGIVVNGHTGEVTSLRNNERARVVQVAVEAVRQRVKVVSGVCAEGSHDAIDQALAARQSGADGILLMPPHHWLRFGRASETAVGFVQDVAQGAEIPIVVHQYPAWTRASYSLAELLALTEIPQVVSIKMGTRDIARQRYDYLTLKSAAPHVSILTCHDEYLLASLLEGSDGALVGFAGYAPELVCRLVRAALDGDLLEARALRDRVDTIARAIYQFGEPSNEAHQRMKIAAYLTGKLNSPVARPPLRPLAQGTIEQIQADLVAAGEEIAFQQLGAFATGSERKTSVVAS